MTTVELSTETGQESLERPTDEGRKHARQRRRAMSRAFRHAIAAAAIGSAAVAVVFALRPRPVVVDVARVQRGPFTVAVEESGMTRVTDRYVVSAPVSGSLSRVAFESGDPVEQGEALARIVPAISPLLDERARAEAEARLAASLSSLEQAKAQALRVSVARDRADQDLLRDKQLEAAGAIAHEPVELADFEAKMRAQELTSAKFAAEVAQEEVRAARATLGLGEASGKMTQGHGRPSGYVEVVAPASGAVLRVQQKSAGVVQAGVPILEVGDPTSLEVVVDLLTTDAVHVQSGTPVTIHGWGGEGMLAGRVRRIEPSAFTRPSALGVDEQRVNVVVALTEPHDRWAALADGYRVEARLVIWQAQDVVHVPQGAVFRRGDGWATFRVEGGQARMTQITIGHRGESDVEITSGLSAGATVIVHPSDRVREGVRVDAR
jgi:HlyD family secretion protein